MFHSRQFVNPVSAVARLLVWTQLATAMGGAPNIIKKK